ncbi:Crp/Fnr family transcriptional regulator [Candidatus Ruminimicrobium bovinum]|uniref:Crp/Fnr family transcriptional regulator n=1 Tax=Candidatus Ruminimicrobium bovinum TaxID=3242779 RepID=UPI0039B9939B
MKFSNLILRIFVNTDLQKDILFLKSIDFFGELSISQLKKIRTHIYKKTYIKKEVIYKKGQQARFLCIVKAGKIELDDGKNKTIIGKRDWFGNKYIFIDNEVYTNTATALEDSEILLMYRDEIEDFLEKEKGIGFNMYKEILKTLHAMAQNER